MIKKHTTEIPIAPVAKPRMTRSDKWKKRPATEKYWNFKDELNALVKGDLSPVFLADFHVAMPKSWSEKKKKEFDGKPHQVRPDGDNFVKALKDCLCEEDSYVYDGRYRKFWAREGKIVLTEYEDTYEVD